MNKINLTDLGITKEFSVTFNYTFSSGLGCYEHSRYLKEMVMRIMLTNEDDEEVEQIGEINFLMIYFDQANSSEFDLFEILDGHTEYLRRIIFEVVDSESEYYTDKVTRHYEDFMGGNICLIEKVTVKPKFRGYQIGAKAIKDLVFSFSSACSLFVLQPFPLQFEYGAEEYTELELDKFEQTEAKALKKLSDYYKKIGFESIKGIKDLLFYNPAYENERFDAIDLEENVFDLKWNNVD